MEIKCALLVVFCFACCSGSLHDVPVGHLKPFGGHRSPDAVEERTDIPSGKEFWENYVKPSKAVVLRGAGKKSPLFTKWTDEFLAENFGDLDLRVEAKRESGGRLPHGDKGIGRDTIRHFISKYTSTNRYAVSELPRPMFSDLMVPPCLSCGDFRKHLVEIDLWLSSFNSSSIVHKDAYNAINCLFNGTKEWKLIDYKYEKKIYQAQEEPVGIGGFSKVNADSVDLLKYPMVAEVPWSYVTINAGDCLFLPKSMYHHVRSVGEKNMAIAILFSRFDGEDSIDLSDCGNEAFTPLSEFEVDWEYPGSGMLSMGNTDLKHVRNTLIKMASGNGHLTKRQILSLILEPTKEKLAEAIRDLMPENGKSVKNITVDVLKSLSKPQLRAFTWKMEEVEPSNTYEHEYALIDREMIMELIETLVDENNALHRETFVNNYDEKLQGSPGVANTIFDDLGGSGKDTIEKSEITEDFDHVFRKFDRFKRGDRFAEGEDGGDAYDRSDKKPQEHDSDEGNRDEL